jgi:hypothetical protein
MVMARRISYLVWEFALISRVIMEYGTKILVGARRNFEYCTPRLTLVGSEEELVYMVL